MSKKRSRPIVAIDGPAGSGKSTVAKLLAKRLGFRHVDTGALYRGVAWVAIQKNVDLESQDAVVRATDGADFQFVVGDSGNELVIDGKNLAKEIRTEHVGAVASKISAYPGVRAALLGLQRKLGQEGGAVLEGRDIATVVFPDAEVKLFLTASIDVRSQRRLAELQQKGIPADLETVKKEMLRRDNQDSTRAIAPLKKAPDATLVDTSGLTIDSVLDQLESIVKQA